MVKMVEEKAPREKAQLEEVYALIKKQCAAKSLDFIPEKVMQNPEGNGWLYRTWSDNYHGGSRYDVEIFVRRKADGTFEVSSKVKDDSERRYRWREW